jgi:hypothetical protein
LLQIMGFPWAGGGSQAVTDSYLRMNLIKMIAQPRRSCNLANGTLWRLLRARESMPRSTATGAPPTRLAHALDVASRAVLATAGGYVAAALTTAGLARWLPIARADAVITGMLSSFAVYALVAIFAFGAARASRVWFWTTAYCVPLGLALYLSMHGGAP